MKKLFRRSAMSLGLASALMLNGCALDMVSQDGRTRARVPSSLAQDWFEGAFEGAFGNQNNSGQQQAQAPQYIKYSAPNQGLLRINTTGSGIKGFYEPELGKIFVVSCQEYRENGNGFHDLGDFGRITDSLSKYEGITIWAGFDKVLEPGSAGFEVVDDSGHVVNHFVSYREFDSMRVDFDSGLRSGQYKFLLENRAGKVIAEFPFGVQ